MRNACTTVTGGPEGASASASAAPRGRPRTNSAAGTSSTQARNADDQHRRTPVIGGDQPAREG